MLSSYIIHSLDYILFWSFGISENTGLFKLPFMFLRALIVKQVSKFLLYKATQLITIPINFGKGYVHAHT